MSIIVVVAVLTITLTAFSLTPATSEISPSSGTPNFGDENVLLVANFESNYDNTAPNASATTFQGNYSNAFNTTESRTGTASVQLHSDGGTGVGNVNFGNQLDQITGSITMFTAIRPTEYFALAGENPLNVSPILETGYSTNHISLQHVVQGGEQFTRLAFIPDNEQPYQGVSFTCSELLIMNEWNTIGFSYNNDSGASKIFVNNNSCSGTLPASGFPQGSYRIGGSMGLGADEYGTLGQYDCLQVFSKELAPETIGELNTQVTTGTCPVDASFATFIPAENNSIYGFGMFMLAVMLAVVLMIFIGKAFMGKTS